ncbi:MAG: Cna B-type domain-containing protein [Ruminococcus sp.]|nr:Cna B-type domain-containing protein [Ruminococcus sp.]
MEKDLSVIVAESNKLKRRRKLWHRTFYSVAVLIVFFTMYVLIIPAITMERGDSPADVETEADRMVSVASAELNGSYRNDLIEIAKTQLGYRESEKNFILDENGDAEHYSRYGAWDGDEYGDWNLSFVSFCLHYAGITEMGYADTSQGWLDLLAQSDKKLLGANDYTPKAGDIVFFAQDENRKNGAAGIVENISDDGTMTVIMQNEDKEVAEQNVSSADELIIGYGIIPLSGNEPVSLSAKTESGLDVNINTKASAFENYSENLLLKVTEKTETEKDFEDDDDVDSEDKDEPQTKISKTLKTAETDIKEEEKAVEEVKLLSLEVVDNNKPVSLNGEAEVSVSSDNLTNDDVVLYSVSGDEDAEKVETEKSESSISFAVNSLDNDLSLVKLRAAAKAAEEDAPLGAPYNAPGEVTTVDNRADGITFNLFDYYGSGLDNSRNTVLSPVYNGINRVKTTYGQNYLLFLGCGDNWDRVYPTNGINCFTGGTSAMQGIINNVLTNGYPTLRTNNSSLDYLFNTSTLSDANAKKVYPDVNHLLQKDSDGYYWYNSDINYAYYNQDTKNFTVYNGTYNNSDGTPIGFFPFNEYDTRYTNVKNTDTNQHYNHHFGLTMDAKFTVPKDKMVNGKDMVFEFSGDDDMWVFVDDVLVLDIGGIHEKVSGTIDFTTGVVTISGAKAASSAGTQGTMGTSTTISDIFSKAGRTYDGSEGTEHTIKFFYMERGGCYSNLSMKLNLCVYNNKDIELEKKVTGETAANYNNTDFDFQIFMEAVAESGEYLPYHGPARYSDGSPVQFDSNGVFKLKPGQKIIIPDVVDVKKYYIRELNVDSRDFSTFKVNGEYVEPVEMSGDDQLFEVISDVFKPKDTVEVIYDNELREGRIPLIVKKVWSDGNDKHTNDKVTFSLLQNGNVYTYNNQTIFELNAQNNWRMRFENLVTESGDNTYTYSVSEVEFDGYTTTYETTFNQGVQTIYINNDKNPEPPNITVEKKWFSHSGKEFEMNGAQDITVQLWRKYYVEGTSGTEDGYLVTFKVDVNDGNSVTEQTVSSVTVSRNSNLSFSAPLWYGANPSGAYANGRPLPSSTYNDPNFGSVSAFYLNNISGNTVVKLVYTQASTQGWIWSNHYNDLKNNFKIINYTPPQTLPPTEGEWIEEMVDEVTINQSSNWKYEWPASETPAVSDDGHEYLYYVKELNYPEYSVEYVNNDGITTGLITVKNTADYEILLPETGGVGTHVYTFGGLVIIAGAIMSGYILRRKSERRKG